MRYILKIIGIFSIVVLILIGCGEDEDESETQSIYGRVFAASPISGAVVSVFDSNGVKLGDDDTDEMGLGSFIIDVTGLPEDFRVVVTGGRDGPRGDEDFAGELKTDVYNFDPEEDIIYVNIVTTMVSAYLEKHPEKTIDEATAIIKDFLEIPRDVDIGDDLHDSELYFSGIEFIWEAEDNGGVNSFIEILLEELDEDPTITQPFPGDTDAGFPVVWLGGQVVGKLIGIGLEQLFSAYIIPDKNQERHEELVGLLKDISRSIGQVLTIVNETKLVILQEKYNAIVREVERDIERMQDIYLRLGNVGADYNQEKLTGKERHEFLERLDGIMNEIKSKEFHSVFPGHLIGVVKGTCLACLGGGILETYARARKNESTFLNAKYSEDLQRQDDLWEYIQILASTLKASYWEYNGDTDQAKEALDDLKKALKAERKLWAPLCEPIPGPDYSGPAPEFQLSCPEPYSSDCLDSNRENICILPIPQGTVIDWRADNGIYPIMLYHAHQSRRVAYANPDPPSRFPSEGRHLRVIFGCDEWAHSCTWGWREHWYSIYYHAPFVQCNGYTKSGPHLIDHVFLNAREDSVGSYFPAYSEFVPGTDVPLTRLNANELLGYSNWRMLTTSEVNAWRALAGGATLREWMIREGYPAGDLNWSLYSTDGSKEITVQYMYMADLVPGHPDYTPRYYYYVNLLASSATSAPRCACSNDHKCNPPELCTPYTKCSMHKSGGYAGCSTMTESFCRRDGAFIPARSLEEDEIYYW